MRSIYPGLGQIEIPESAWETCVPAGRRLAPVQPMVVPRDGLEPVKGWAWKEFIIGIIIGFIIGGRKV